MTQARTPRSRFRLKLAAGVAGGLVACALLVLLSQWIQHHAQEQARSNPVAPASAPADEPAPPTREEAAARSMGGLMMMLAMISFILAVVCAGWLVFDVYQSQPAWKRQTKYPRKR